MPGVLIVEALAQATGLLAMASRPEEVGEKSLYYFVGIDKARFKRPVEPGDQLFLEVSVLHVKRGIWKFAGEARVDDKTVATAEIMCTAGILSLDSSKRHRRSSGPLAEDVEVGPSHHRRRRANRQRLTRIGPHA
jgi:hypothetical protein